MPKRLTDEEAVPVMKAAGLTPLEPYSGSHRPWRCRCNTCGKVVTPAYGDIRRGQGGCGSCAGNLSHTDAQAVPVMKAAGLTPLDPYPGNNKVPWRCRCDTCGREVTPRFDMIARGQGGCVYCAGIMVDGAEAEKVMRDAGAIPLESYPGSNSPWRCRCNICEREITPRYNGVNRGTSACGYCAHTRVDPASAEELMRAASLTPLEPYPGSQKPWRCLCKTCGNAVVTMYLTVQQGGGGCRFCGNQKKSDSLRLAHSEAALIMEAAGLQPLDNYSSSWEPWRCLCKTCDRVVTPTRANVQQGGGCKYCGSHGFQFDLPALVYLLEAEHLKALKIGVTNVQSKTDRIQQHRDSGWKVVKTWDFEIGNLAVDIEQAVLFWWREDLNLPSKVEAAQMPQAGYTETVDSEAISGSETIEFVDLVLWKIEEG